MHFWSSATHKSNPKPMSPSFSRKTLKVVYVSSGIADRGLTYSGAENSSTREYNLIFKAMR
jgi:hypothetical protein